LTLLDLEEAGVWSFRSTLPAIADVPATAIEIVNLVAESYTPSDAIHK
tara:strand:+ start:825 stop:968 length:144 start_codon:yes stop_codon:yes gene_type:complete